MDKLEKAELIVEKTGVLFEDAKDALEANDYDVLDAIVWLERQGRTARQTASYTTGTPDDVVAAAEMSQAQSDYERATKQGKFSRVLSNAMDILRVGLKKCVDTSFVVRRHGDQILSVPVLVLLLLIVFAFWITIPLLVIGLFCDFKYRFEGIGAVTVDINEVADRVSEGIDNFKRDVTRDNQ